MVIANKTDVQAVLRWAAKRKTVSASELKKVFAPQAKRGRVGCLLAVLAQGTGYLVKKVFEGEYQVKRAIHVAWEESETESPGLRDAMKELHDLALHGLAQESALDTSLWTRSERSEFLHKILAITGRFVRS